MFNYLSVVEILSYGKVVEMLIIIIPITLLIALKLIINKQNKMIDDELDEYKNRINIIFSNNHKSFGESDKNNTCMNTTRTSKQLMENNLLEIKEYYIMSKHFANMSFKLAIISCIIGIVLIIVAIVAFWITKTLNYLPIVSASLLEIIGATSLFIFKNSQKGLNKYFQTLHENEQFLTIIDLVDNISNDEEKNKAYLLIVNEKLKNKI